MKSIVILCAAVFAVVAAGDINAPEYKEKIDKCKKETGVSDEIAQRLLHKDFDLDDKAGKCFSKCICYAKSFCVEDGKLDTTEFEAKKPEFDKKKVRVSISTCDKPEIKPSFSV